MNSSLWSADRTTHLKTLSMTDTDIQFFEDTSFDLTTTHILGQAFKCVCKELHDCGQSALVSDIIAKRIISIARTGERDPNRLCYLTLRSFGLPAQR